MIAVIADDLTGAAELAGVAYRHGLVSEVQTVFDLDADVDLTAINVGTRLSTAEEARRRVAAAAQVCRERGIAHIYKKVDSVLRGHVIVELAALMETWGADRAFLLPANPSLGRTVVSGHYRICGIPLDHTDFARDPVYPASTDEVLGILRPSEVFPVHLCRLGAPLPAHGILVGDAATSSDVLSWARCLDQTVVPAGASEFFGAYLRELGHRPLVRPVGVLTPPVDALSLFVSGSSSATSRSFCRQCESSDIPIVRIPLELLEGSGETDRLMRVWSEGVLSAFDHHEVVVAAIDRPPMNVSGPGNGLSEYLADCAARVLDARSIEFVFVEGGETAAALVRRLGWTRLWVEAELAPGIVSLRVPGAAGPTLTMKPGSYTWPNAVWALVRRFS